MEKGLDKQMDAIIIFGGTTEGRELAEALGDTATEVYLCVATAYGASLLPRYSNVKVCTGRMDAGDMEALLQTVKPGLVVDATHPYAVVVTENIKKVCQRLSCPLLRILREEADSGGIFGGAAHKTAGSVEGERIFVSSVEAAAAYLADTKGKILITTGSKELEKYAGIEAYRSRCIARVLPDLAVIEKCAGLGFTGRNLIAMQGPFSEEMNYQMLKQTGCSYLVTKDSGKEGGYAEKCKAAMRAGVKLIVVARPGEAAGDNTVNSGGKETAMSLQEALEYLSGMYDLNLKRTAYLIGAGPGAAELFTGEAVSCLQESDCVIGAERILKSCSRIVQKPQFSAYRAEDVAAILREHREFRKAALVYSGDIGFYSGGMGMAELLKDFKVVLVSGISTVQYFLNRIGAGWQDTELVSRHGRQTCLIPLLLRKGKVFTLLGRDGEAAEICRSLIELGLDGVRVAVGESLSYPEERIVQGTPQELQEMEFDRLSVMYLEYKREEGSRVVTPGLRDKCFIRNCGGEHAVLEGKPVPMTKQGIRILSLAMLELTEDAVVYDIGAGTGSVAVEAARLCPAGYVYAIERKRQAAELIKRNRIRFHTENLSIAEGAAPEILDTLPAPTHVFIGGSGGNLLEIIETVRKKNPAARFVVNAVTLETMAQIQRIPEVFSEYQDMEVLLAGLSKSGTAGNYHMMYAENPVLIVCFGGILL